MADAEVLYRSHCGHLEYGHAAGEVVLIRAEPRITVRTNWLEYIERVARLGGCGDSENPRHAWVDAFELVDHSGRQFLKFTSAAAQDYIWELGPAYVPDDAGSVSRVDPNAMTVRDGVWPD
ncbi:hypothetical protein [Rhodococcus sp. KRD162]|uniref:hypothetical protein n=1 Tax=Rhodococcus sp. KRD162 TaxID=2729725 RepID=UPI0019D2AC0C|nr:hypothetical protein [Rhodococcus sp. KRD162]